jgi:hypothetical protein
MIEKALEGVILARGVRHCGELRRGPPQARGLPIRGAGKTPNFAQNEPRKQEKIRVTT